MSDLSVSSELTNIQALNHLLDSMRIGKYDVKQNGTPVALGEKLGAGSSKTVFDAEIDGEHFALALPNVNDGVERMQKKWNMVLQEPANTSRIRALGIPANPVCELLAVEINGVPFQALKMSRFQDVPFEIRDSKNPSSSIYRTALVPPEGLNPENFRQLFSGIMDDLEILLKNGIDVHQDSINICIDKGGPRLYLNDLGDAEWSLQPDLFSSEYYTQRAIKAFASALKEEEYEANRDFFGLIWNIDGTGISYFQLFGKELYERLKDKTRVDNKIP